MFVSGQTAIQNALACETIDIIDDNVVEMNDESLTLSLSEDDPSVTVITAPFATVIISEEDNDGIPQGLIIVNSKLNASWGYPNRSSLQQYIT